jgi:DNA-dependent RNA polymerase auxiliary subunit epsilon
LVNSESESDQEEGGDLLGNEEEGVQVLLLKSFYHIEVSELVEDERVIEYEGHTQVFDMVLDDSIPKIDGEILSHDHSDSEGDYVKVPGGLLVVLYIAISLVGLSCFFYIGIKIMFVCLGNENFWKTDA